MEHTLNMLAAAKINLTLDILGQREDGYHLMQMVMQSVSLYDRVSLTLGVPGIRLLCDRPMFPAIRETLHGRLPIGSIKPLIKSHALPFPLIR